MKTVVWRSLQPLQALTALFTRHHNLGTQYPLRIFPSACVTIFSAKGWEPGSLHVSTLGTLVDHLRFLVGFAVHNYLQIACLSFNCPTNPLATSVTLSRSPL